jgi:RNA-binding protein
MPNAKDNRRLRRIGHQLQPVVTVAERGLSPAVIEETQRRLSDHELIKVRISVEERTERREVADALASACDADIVQRIGKIVLLLKPNPEPDPKLSNLARFGA